MDHCNKILIIVPPVRLNQIPSRFPLGLGYLSAILEKNSFNISILDLNLLRLNSKKEKQIIKKYMQDVDIVCTGGMITMFKTISKIAANVKDINSDVKILLGGPIAGHLQEYILHNSQIDILVSGEGEEVILNLIKAIRDDKNISKIHGLSYIEKGKLVKTEDSERISDLDALPFPAYHLFDFAQYLKNNNYTADIIGSRGCPFSCSFCHRNFGNKVFSRSVKSVIDEIIYLKTKYNIKHIHLEDELFVLRKDYVLDFCRSISQIDDLTWSACARASTLTFELIKKIKNSGCNALMIGLESFSDDVLKNINKQVTASQNEQVCEWMNYHGLTIRPGLIIGMSNESVYSIRKTINACVRYNIDVNEWQYAFATPYPGTEIYNYAKNNNLITSDKEYIELISAVGDTKDLAVNLSNISNKDLIRYRKDALIEIKTKNNWLDFLDKNYIKFNKDIKYENYIQYLCLVEIEVFSFCNRKCWFCTNTVIDRACKNEYLSEKNYLKILKELSDNKFNGIFSFSRYNEPFADEIIYKRIKQARKLLPHIELVSNTNGDYLDEKVIKKIEESGLNSLRIQIYMDFDKQKILEEVDKRMKKYNLKFDFTIDEDDYLCWETILGSLKIKMYARDFNKNGNDRGGVISELKSVEKRIEPCNIPLFNVYIDYNGNVMPCCNLRSDIKKHQKLILGNINESNLVDVIFNEKACTIRKSIFSLGKHPSVCRYCKFCFIDTKDASRKKYQLGFFYEKSGYIEEAVDCYKNVISDAVNDYSKAYIVSSYYHLGLLLDKKKEKQLAYKACLKLVPDHKKAKENLEGLKL